MARNRQRRSSRAGTRAIINIARTYTNTPFTSKTGAFAGYSTLLRNNTGGPSAEEQTAQLVGQKYRISRLLFNAQVEGGYANFNEVIENLALWVVKVPEGFDVTNEAELWAYPYKHPEWVLGWKFFGNGLNYTSTSPNRIDSIPQLAVRSNRSVVLNPGDSVIAIVTGNGAADIAERAMLVTGIVDCRLTIM